ncbi:hypothetical protein H5410_056659 [Solanum commersonii]|uniref:Uncharacterized protein n=1 Tax=Solanum commersonii TaxID=4109 RepID=A0A9J5WMD6_SOLCO|nr:hypothetical protein H5410_056659 [Solanum commersonii]
MAEVPDGPEAGVSEDASVGNESTSTSGEVSAGAALLPSASSWVYSISIRQMSVEKVGVTLISLIASWGNSVRRHTSLIRTRQG